MRSVRTIAKTASVCGSENPHVPKTLLAVDDSATMRKVLEITFAGEDFRVVTADGGEAALQKMSEEPAAVVIDTSLPGADGYALAKEVRSRDPRAVIVILSSRYMPYDPGRGKDAGVDDFIDKPFDSQAIIDKVRKAIVARETGKAAPVVSAAVTSPAPPVVAPVAPPPPPPTPSPLVSPRPPVVAPVSASRPNFPTQRTHTLSFEGSGPSPNPHAVTAPPAHPVPPISRTAPSGVPVVHTTAPLGAAPPPAPQLHTPTMASRTVEPARPEPAPVAAAVNGQLAGKLGDLGLTPGQVEAVLALSREVVERVVWEVVPQLAEAIIKEEIARITKD
jgi:CheY-like chemotaxis protein